MSTPSAHAASTGVAAIRDMPAPARPNPLLTVLRWELRRLLVSRSTKVMVVLLVVVYFLLLGFSLQHDTIPIAANVLSPDGSSSQQVVYFNMSRNTPWGLADVFPITLLEFVLFLPFITADGVSLDLSRRTHEVLMATALPSRAYVWGRYLADMLIALGMACVYLLALLVLSVAFHLTQPDSYPAVDPPSTLLVWAVVVLPPTLLVGSLCFAFGLLLPRQSNLVKAGTIFAWLALGLILQAFTFDLVRNDTGFAHGTPPAWWTAYETWQPASTDAGHLFAEQFLYRIEAMLGSAPLSESAILQQARALSSQLPDLGPFALAHLVWVAVGLVAVAAASLTFRRFRNVVA